MVVPEAVLRASRELNVVLAAIDANRQAHRPRSRGEGEAAEQALADLKAAEPALTALRRIMREDLGVPN